MRRAASLIGLSVALLGASAHATTVLDLSLPQLASRAAIVCRGTVVETKAAWHHDGGAIVTRVRVHVTESMKGDQVAPVGHEIVVMETGGVVDGVGQSLPGAAHFDAGEDVVVFLEPSRRDADTWILPTMAASKFHVSAGADGKTLLTRETGELSFAYRDAGRWRPTSRTPVPTITVEALRVIVRTADAAK